jgi:flagellar hook assembly protein FlgD
MDQSKVGSVEITVSNADKTDNHTFQVLWEGAQGQIARETVTDGEEWIRINVPPGQYTTMVSATIGGKPTSRKSVVNVAPGESKKVDITLPTGVLAASTP